MTNRAPESQFMSSFTMNHADCSWESWVEYEACDPESALAKDCARLKSLAAALDLGLCCTERKASWTADGRIRISSSGLAFKVLSV